MAVNVPMASIPSL